MFQCSSALNRGRERHEMNDRMIAVSTRKMTDMHSRKIGVNHFPKCCLISGSRKGRISRVPTRPSTAAIFHKRDRVLVEKRSFLTITPSIEHAGISAQEKLNQL